MLDKEYDVNSNTILKELKKEKIDFLGIIGKWNYI